MRARQHVGRSSPRALMVSARRDHHINKAMNAKSLLPEFRARALAGLLLGLALVGSPAFAQGTGAVTGRVSDAATGKSLQGAVVRVAGSSVVAHTDADGRFILSGVP